MDLAWRRTLLVVAVLFVVSMSESTPNTTIHSLTPTPSTPHTSTPSPTLTSSSHSSTILKSSHTPHVTPSPGPTSAPTQNRYMLEATTHRRSLHEVCLLMNTKMVLRFDYTTNEDKESTKLVPIGEAASVNYNRSMCQLSICAEPTSAILVVEYSGFTITLAFNETEGNSHWVSSYVTVNYTINEETFPNLKNTGLNGKSVSARTEESLFDWTARTILLPSSYSCATNTTLSGFNNTMTNENIRVSMSFSDLQVQAFKFDSNGTRYDNDHNCYADRRIIVPVAVAVALALLITVVLILFLVKLAWRKYKEHSEFAKQLKYSRLAQNSNY